MRETKQVMRHEGASVATSATNVGNLVVSGLVLKSGRRISGDRVGLPR